MADIRIKDLATTAASSSSDDFIAIDGSANGTRKLNAYSPTFGGTLTVNGPINGLSSVGISNAGTSGTITFDSSAAAPSASYALLRASSLTGQIGLGVGKALSSGNSGFIYWDQAITSLVLETYASASPIKLNGTSTTVSGTLTVSGAGTSSIGGLLNLEKGLSQTSTSTTGIQWKLYNSSLTSAISIGVGKAETSGNTVFFGWNYNGGTPYGFIETYAAGAPLSLQESGGTVLIGKTTDSANGKLQLAESTSSAGGIGFGADTALYRIATGGIALSDNGTRQTNFYCDSGGSYIGSNDTRSLFLRTNNTTALTLDSSQNATFAQHITVGGNFAGTGAAISSSINSAGNAAIYGYNYNAAGYGLYVGGGLSYFAGEATFNSNAVINGVLKLGNAYVSGAPTATGYVTIKDSAGNTYKVLVGT